MSESEKEPERTHGIRKVRVTEGFLRLDDIYFGVAQDQVEWYLQFCRKVEQEQLPLSPIQRLVAEVRSAATSMAMLCAAMEAHANFLLDASAHKRFPNEIHLSGNGSERIINSLEIQTKWLFVSVMLTGKQVLDPGEQPFQGFSDAVKTRNNLVAHPKLREKPFDKWHEPNDLTIRAAQAAIKAAQDTVIAVYTAMEREPPAWTRSQGGSVMFLRGE